MQAWVSGGRVECGEVYVVLAPVRILVAEETFGKFIERLRGDETAASVARRMTRLGEEYEITSSYIGKLERDQVKEPGLLTLRTLAEAYKDRWERGRDSLFWELWRRSGYPMPAGWFELTEEERAMLAEMYRLRAEQRADEEQDLKEQAEGQ